MREYETLTRPDIFEGMPFFYRGIADSLDRQGKRLLNEGGISDEPRGQKMTVAIRTMNEADTLDKLLDSVQRQIGSDDTELVVVDNESTDGTKEVARSYGAQVLTISRNDFSYPRSMNMAMEAASHDHVYLTVGHAILASKVALEAAKRHFAADSAVAGVYAFPIANANASKVDLMFDAMKPVQMKKSKAITKADMGVLGATNAILSKEAWEDYGGFDESLGMGGEDTDLARKLLADGRKLIFEPLVTVHHSHGLGLVDYIRQIAAWNAMKKGQPAEFDANKIKARRPDLDFS